MKHFLASIFRRSRHFCTLCVCVCVCVCVCEQSQSILLLAVQPATPHPRQKYFIRLEALHRRSISSQKQFNNAAAEALSYTQLGSTAFSSSFRFEHYSKQSALIEK